MTSPTQWTSLSKPQETVESREAWRPAVHAGAHSLIMPDSVTPWTVAHQAPSIHGIVQVTVLEWAAISFSRGSSQPRS